MKEKKITQILYMKNVNIKYYPLIIIKGLHFNKNVKFFNLLLDGPNNIKL